MTSDTPLTGRIRFYLWTVVVLGSAAIGQCLLSLGDIQLGAHGGRQWALLALLTLISGSASVKLPWSNVSISISEAFVFTVVLLYGPSAGTLTVALDCLVISFWIARRRPQLDRALFNLTAPALAAWCSSHLFFSVAGIDPLLASQVAVPKEILLFNKILPALVLFAIVYFVLNSWLIAFVVAAEKRLSAWDVWRTGFIWLSLTYFSGASVAFLVIGLVVGSDYQIDYRFVLVITPLLVVLYFTFKTAIQRIEDANAHLDQMNSLYLSTIETLAMAIDAKDQITHGHVRRVQSFAVQLARRVGISDPKLIKAIEAAALLHDMGKLAVPEYILNKPGALTTAEFEKIKVHASVGADILASIDFPYPVVPIVRHHHENWDGSGYPNGLKGTNIPIGARILSVVDCFDALTSDRPYRPRLTDEDAIKVLVARRGTMYDPLVVDTFLKVHNDDAWDGAAAKSSSGDLDEVRRHASPTDSRQGAVRLDEIAAGVDEMLTLYELARALARQTDRGEIMNSVTSHVRRLVPCALSVFYIYRPETDDLEAQHATGDLAFLVKGLKIRVGHGLSGWVAANKQTILNSDPVLDLGAAARRSTPRLRSCLSTPLLAGDELIGVLSLYAEAADAFNDDSRRIVEAVAHQLCGTSSRDHPVDYPKAAEIAAIVPNSRPLPGLPQLEQFFDSVRGGSSANTAMLFIGLTNDAAASSVGAATLNALVEHVALRVRTVVPQIQIFRCGEREIVGFLGAGADSEGIAARIRMNICGTPFLTANGGVILIDANVSCQQMPAQLESVRTLIALARNQTAAEGRLRNDATIH